MRHDILRRLPFLILSLLIVSFIVFSLAQLILGDVVDTPGDVVDTMVEEQADVKDIEERCRQIGIDQSTQIVGRPVVC